jgi:hypothetical protein
MTTAKRQLEEHLLDLAWSLWTELGVAGVRREHRQVAIMLEELLLLTSALSSLDPRLRDESIDWCCRYHRYVSTARLRSLFNSARVEQKTALSRFSATVNALATTRWPTLGDAQPWRVTPAGKSSLPELTHPALLHLRLRALFGTGARADVLAALLGRDTPNASVAEVARIGYTKRNIANVLDELTASGLLIASQTQNQLRYRWAKREAFEALVKPLPRQLPNWRPIVDLVTVLYWFVERTEPMPTVVRGVEAVNLLPSIDRQLALLRWEPVRLGRSPEKSWDQLANWAVKIVRTVASGSMSFR